MSNSLVYYIPVHNPNVLLEDCEALLKSLVQRIIERDINGYSNYTDKSNIACVKVTKLKIHFS